MDRFDLSNGVYEWKPNQFIPDIDLTSLDSGQTIPNVVSNLEIHLSTPSFFQTVSGYRGVDAQNEILDVWIPEEAAGAQVGNGLAWFENLEFGKGEKNWS